jgi:hypothetical protein
VASLEAIIAARYSGTGGVTRLGLAVTQRALSATLIRPIFPAGMPIAGAWSPQCALLLTLIPADTPGTAYRLGNRVWCTGSLLAPAMGHRGVERCHRVFRLRVLCGGGTDYHRHDSSLRHASTLAPRRLVKAMTGLTFLDKSTSIR